MYAIIIRSFDLAYPSPSPNSLVRWSANNLWNQRCMAQIPTIESTNQQILSACTIVCVCVNASLQSCWCSRCACERVCVCVNADWKLRMYCIICFWFWITGLQVNFVTWYSFISQLHAATSIQWTRALVCMCALCICIHHSSDYMFKNQWI